MKRGDLYRAAHLSAQDPRRSRVFVVVSRQLLIDSRLSTLIWAPIYTSFHGLTTQILIGGEEGLKHESSIHCDELISLPKSVLTNYVGTLLQPKIDQLATALAAALGIGTRKHQERTG